MTAKDSAAMSALTEKLRAANEAKAQRREPDRDELDKWADCHDDRRVIDDFLEWCSGQSIELAAWEDGARWPRPLVEKRDVTLNRYFEIDEKRLEDQRRALLDEQRALNAKAATARAALALSGSKP